MSCDVERATQTLTATLTALMTNAAIAQIARIKLAVSATMRTTVAGRPDVLTAAHTGESPDYLRVVVRLIPVERASTDAIPRWPR